MKFPNLKPQVSALAAVSYTLLSGVIGAALSGGAAGAAGAVKTGNIDPQIVGSSAAAGAVIAMGAYLVRSPWAPKSE